MEKRSCDISEALEELRKVITKHTPQGSKTHRSGEDKVEYLYNAMIRVDGALNVISD